MFGGMTDSNTDTARSVARFNYSEPPPDPLAGQIKPWSELLEGTIGVHLGDDCFRGEVVMLAWWAPSGGRENLYLKHHTGGTPLDDRNKSATARVIGELDQRAIIPRTEEQAIAAVWARWRMKHDPPGLRVARAPGVQTHVEQRWFVEVIDAPGVGPVAEDGGLFLFELDARRAAWKWYDDRLDFESEEGCLLEDHDGAPVPAAPVWPRCLAWPDRTVVEVKAWILTSDGELWRRLRRIADPDAPLPEVLRWYEMTDGSAERWEPVDVG